MARPTNLVQAIIGMIKGNFFEKRIQVKSTPDGMAALMRAKDGNVYIVTVSASSDSKLKGLFNKELDKK